MGQNDYNQENVVLCEALASHGYIVATVPDLGPLPRRSQLLVSDPASYEAQIRDLEFALAEVLRLPSADASKIAAIGHSMGGIYVLLLAMRDDRIGAIVGLDASYMDALPRFYFKFEDAWYFDVSRISAPLLSLYRKDDDPDVTMAMLDQLRYSDRTLMAIPKVIHTDFNSYPMITAENPPVKLDTYAKQHRDQQAAVVGHIFIVEAVLEFLRDSFGGSRSTGGNLMQRCADVSLQGATADCKKLESLKAPNEEGFAAIAVKDGPDAATRVYDEAKALAPQEIIIREKVLNRIGFEPVYLGRPQDAVKILQLNVHAYPQSSDAYENLAEAYEAEGDKPHALENYKTALALNPDNKDASDGMKKLSPQK
jgi:tetratricopeptide (TPR) repeat protein